MGTARKKNKKSAVRKETVSFVITLVTLSVVFIFVGVLLGQYAVRMLQDQHTAQVHGVQSTPVQSSPPATATSPPPTQPSSPETSAPEPPTSPSPASPPQTTPQASTGGLYKVQVGAFSSLTNAERVQAQVIELGYEAIISSGPPYRVQTGAFSARENAVRLSEELSREGFEVTVVQ